MYEKSPISVYDEDNMLWETKVGRTDIEGRPLLYSAWGETEKESMDMADLLIKMLLIRY